MYRTMASSKNLPALHSGAFRYKNLKRLQHDGGRAWIKDSQLHSAVHKGDLRLRHEPKAEGKEG